MRDVNQDLTRVRGISIRACVVIGAICLERFCRNLAINMEAMRPLLQVYWAFPSTEHITDLDDWRAELKFFWMEDDEEMPPGIIERLNHLGQPIKEDFTSVLNAVAEIGMGDMYGATTDVPWASLIATFAVLERHGIPLPDLEPFRVSASTQSDPWGDPVASEIVQQWRQQFLERAT
jgi:hypothetical protein